MHIALMSASMLDRSWEATLDAAAAHDVHLIEACSGGHIPKRHYDPIQLVTDDTAFDAFCSSLDNRGLSLCGLSCHGNPLHPDKQEATRVHDDFVATCELAAKLGVLHVSLLAGCPGGGPGDKTPNWIINSTFPDWKDAYEWQWGERVLPYWRNAVATADRYHVKICVEPHSADVVYSLETFLRLHDAIGATIGLNFDPSHLWWQGVDPLAFINAAGEHIYTVHVKDAIFDSRAVALNGVASAESYDAWDRRPWSFSTPGYGHSELFWAQFVRALRNANYAGALSIECEDPFMSPDDTLKRSVDVLRNVIPSSPRPAVDWAAVAID
jgi:sugar phosphate isomerase/epimerase